MRSTQQLSIAVTVAQFHLILEQLPSCTSQLFTLPQAFACSSILQFLLCVCKHEIMMSSLLHQNNGLEDSYWSGLQIN